MTSRYSRSPRLALRGLDGAVSGVVGGDHLGDVAGELPDGVEVGVPFDRRHDVQTARSGGLHVRTSPSSSSTSATSPGVALHHREIVGRRVEVEDDAVGSVRADRAGTAMQCTVTQFWLASHRRASRRSAVGCTTVPPSLPTLTRPIQPGSDVGEVLLDEALLGRCRGGSATT